MENNVDEFTKQINQELRAIIQRAEQYAETNDVVIKLNPFSGEYTEDRYFLPSEEAAAKFLIDGMYDPEDVEATAAVRKYSIGGWVSSYGFGFD